ncbi:MAG: PAS domain S-box protein [Nitrospirae bacterium]|nr:PAS domain S-box protein [Nitrospirota bacterium]MBF0540474.1 PAS domain S-box protein [Nitrospirota bacterium]
MNTMINFFNKIITDTFININQWYLLGISIFVSEFFTTLIVSIMSVIFYGNIRDDYLITGFITAFFVSLIVVYTLTILVQGLKDLNEKNIRAKEQWERTFNTISDLIMLIDNDYKIVRMNKAMAVKLDLTLDEVIDKTCYKLVHNMDKPIVNCPHNQMLKDSLEHMTEIYDDRLNAYFHVIVTPMLNPDGTVFGSVQVMRDITELKTIENALKEKTYALDLLNKDLEDRVKREIELRMQKEQMLIHQSKMAAMGEMIEAITHQWKQPLSSVSLIAQDMGDAFLHGELDEQYIVKSVKHIMDQVRHMSRTIDDFKNFFQPSKQKIPFKVNTAIYETLLLIYRQLEKAEISVVLNCIYEGAVIQPGQSGNTNICKCEPEIVVIGYPGEFKHVILNLINNSRDAILEKWKQSGSADEQKGEILIELNTKNDLAIISVMDNGCGISDNIYDKIFEPYVTMKKDGMGIGLYISKTIIEQNMKGRLYAEKFNNGARFMIELPLKQELQS